MHNIPSVVTKGRKRVGRGVGSGKGFHTTGRGQKGQKARYKVGILFEGVKTKKSLLHRLPMLPGKGRFKAQPNAVAVSLTTLEKHPAGDVTVESLLKAKLVGNRAKKVGVKILGNGKVSKKFTLKVSASKSAALAVTEAGGTIA